MAKSIYGDDEGQGNPYVWKSGDTTTFADQAKNLAEQAGTAGLNTDQINVQRQTAQNEQAAGQSGENVAAGADQVAQGAQVDPSMAQNSQNGQQIQPYVVTQQAPNAPSTDVTYDPSLVEHSIDTYDPSVQAYLSSLFNGDLPQSVQDALGKSIASGGISGDLIPVGPFKVPENNANLSQLFNDYLNSMSNTFSNKAGYENFLNNEMARTANNINATYQGEMTGLTNQMNDKQKAISDYIKGLNDNLANYKKNTQDLSNIGNLSDVERDAAARNAILAQGNSGVGSLAALTGGGGGSSRFAALSQQAENAAINDAQAKAAAIQEMEKNSQKMLAQGQKAQQDAYTNAGNTITKNQNDTLNKLNNNATAAQKALSDAYNNAKTNLTKEQQDYVNKAQDTLRNAKIPEENIKTAAQSFADVVSNYIAKNKLNDSQKADLKNQLESIWRISVGTNPSDIYFSDQIANILYPIMGQL